MMKGRSNSGSNTSIWPALNVPQVKSLEENSSKGKEKEHLDPGSSGANPGNLTLNWELRPAPSDPGVYNQKELPIESKHDQNMESMENVLRDQDMVVDCFADTNNTSKSDEEFKERGTTIMQIAQSATKHNNLSPKNNQITVEAISSKPTN